MLSKFESTFPDCYSRTMWHFRELNYDGSEIKSKIENNVVHMLQKRILSSENLCPDIINF